MEKQIACKLTTPELQQRKQTVIASLRSKITGTKETGSGYAYTFEADDPTLDEINDFIKTERICCDFFTFNLQVANDSITLEISGPEGTKQFIKETLNF